jgi:hypothetical protein
VHDTSTQKPDNTLTMDSWSLGTFSASIVSDPMEVTAFSLILTS